MVDLLDKYVLAINDVLWTYVIVALLIVAGLYFTIRSRFVQFRFIKEMFRLLGEGMGKKDGISSFQAFCISTASRVGVGNIAGVAMAIAIGGPGAVFWMWLIALIGSASAFIEATLAQVYKVKDGDTFRGGPAYYMEKGLNRRWMGILFAILITLCFGLVFNSVQANTITVAFESTYGINRAVLGLIIAAVFAIIIFGGIKRVARFTEWIVPIMAVIYILLALYVVLTNITQLPAVFKQIFAGAFGLEQAIGGGIGAAMMQGIKRGLFSNEAGMGSAPNAAATATVSHPAKQGLIQALGVFVDTLIICSCTSMIVLFSSAFTHDNLSGIEIAQLALNQQVGVWAEHFLTISILLFAFSSLIGNYYYGETNIEFIRENKTWLLIYRLAVIAMVIWGSITQVQVVWDLADLFMGLMAILNLIAILLLGKVAFAVLQDYHQQLKEGKNPSFASDQIKDLANADCWEKSESARRTG
ncbi:MULTISPECIES: sodium:alanine symporter family protein [Thermoactinomyces]|jgi:alanine or glycine:cation symporter, AGCS family|uniref:alanine/glycine:cation symporter family protein n=1 Tax=Thermoactinomyces TaxID=2023 RepID=UPI0005015583|nr:MULTISPECIES: alanine/glycine:cation symporter family protein [Thermoactinomyces]KFZ41003.1 sodium:alanine symporter [Thermoactinomyces sp. Gus2-1]MBH8584217.1 alanine:cation symporter family protein [Thermoactinomyces sp. CICC 10735]MBH8586635.1 alanine:cation symporter family protein [Thermoactinomyces sp. CICC 10520]MBI0387612.1 alanine:cation symporter family protein [Thermoactinomyces sp. CICC 24227]MBI0392387.1 alanine:cation symporter family protein [Thermoactinomyces sp. CICC 24226]